MHLYDEMSVVVINLMQQPNTTYCTYFNQLKIHQGTLARG
jgi:hypothetical protein